jgi:hypothetical protein
VRFIALPLPRLAIEDHRVQMRKLMESISGAGQIAGHVVLYPLLRGWRRGWGTTEAERPN